MRPLAIGCAALLAGFVSSAALAQSTPSPQPAPTLEAARVVVVDQDRLFSDSSFGKRVRAEFVAESNALAEENRRMEAELIEEEQKLTEDRASLTPEEFRALADEFNLRVNEIRTTQDRKARALTERQNAARQEFFQAVLPVLQQLLQDSGAQAMLDRRSVLISLGSIDVTSRAIAQIDAILGDGVGSILETPNPVQE